MSPKKDKADKLAAKKLGKKADKRLAKNAASAASLPENDLTDAEINELQANVQVSDWGEGAPPRKAKAFWPSTIRLLRTFHSERGPMTLVLVMIVIAVVFNTWAPHVLGDAMNVIFGGVVAKQMPEGLTSAQVVDGLRTAGENQLADMLSGMEFTPGHGIDFEELARLILIVLGMYVIAQLFMWLQGRVLNDVVMRIVFKLRQDIEAKVNRLPLQYFDRNQRGDLLFLARVGGEAVGLTTGGTDLVDQRLQLVGAAPGHAGRGRPVGPGGRAREEQPPPPGDPRLGARRLHRPGPRVDHHRQPALRILRRGIPQACGDRRLRAAGRDAGDPDADPPGQRRPSRSRKRIRPRRQS